MTTTGIEQRIAPLNSGDLEPSPRELELLALQAAHGSYLVEVASHIDHTDGSLEAFYELVRSTYEALQISRGELASRRDAASTTLDALTNTVMQMNEAERMARALKLEKDQLAKLQNDLEAEMHEANLAQGRIAYDVHQRGIAIDRAMTTQVSEEELAEAMQLAGVEGSSYAPVDTVDRTVAEIYGDILACQSRDSEIDAQMKQLSITYQQLRQRFEAQNAEMQAHRAQIEAARQSISPHHVPNQLVTPQEYAQMNGVGSVVDGLLGGNEA